MKAHQTLILRISRSFRLAITLLLPALVVTLIACTAHGASYTFTNIADSNGIFAPTVGEFTGIGTGFLSINNFGVAAFSSRLDDGSSGVFKGNGGPVTPIALSSGSMFSLVAGASINASGTVAFVGQLGANGSGIYTGNGGSLTTIAVSGGGFTGFGPPRMNDAGRVVFGASLGGGNTGIFLRGAGPGATVALSTGPMFSDLGDSSINSSGTVAFRALSTSGDGIFTGNGGPVTTISLAPMPQAITPSINDFGTVAFAIDSGSFIGTRILTGSGGPLTTYVSNAGPYSGFGIYPAINNSGTVAFLAGLDDGRVGLFTGSDPVADKVVLSNEPLFGSTLVGVVPGTVQSPGAIDINDSGQIAFHYTLADGREGIAVATPFPEPSALVLLFVGSSLFFRSRFRRATEAASTGKSSITADY